MDEHAVHSLALQQHGLITRSQATALGGTDRIIHRCVEAGRWHRVRSGVYIVGAAARTWELTALASLLAAGPGATLHDRSAARALGLVERSGRVQIAITDRRRVRLAGVEIHRPVDLPQTDITTIGALTTTTPARTLIDMAPSQSTATMGSLLDASIRQHGVQPDDVARRVVELAGRGRAVPRSLIEALSLRCPGYDPGRSALESRVLAALLRAGIPLPKRQHQVERPGGKLAFIDLAYPEWMVAIEVDGWAHHGQRAAFDADRMRSNDLVLLGWSVLRFTSAMADEQICATVAQALGI